ncbi:hypothetical protein CSUI_007291 [Cystoisospora suis]|uniref:Uncharacterized protein n=1 Tax=Cystoisospora suis TaxID=483139 RepID=A0A2C6JVS8_9APIC|nr:hypothetical protein CSUI_007291 [Cystoisospora suis]
MGTETMSQAAPEPESGSSAVSSDYVQGGKAARRDEPQSKPSPESQAHVEEPSKSQSGPVEHNPCGDGGDFALPGAAALLEDGFRFFLFTSPSQLVPLEAPTPCCCDSEDGEPSAMEEADSRPFPYFRHYGDCSPFPVSEALFKRLTYDVAVVKETCSPAASQATAKDKQGDGVASWPASFPAFLPPGRPIDANATFVAYGLGASVRLMPIVGSPEDGPEKSFKASLLDQLSGSSSVAPVPKPTAVSVSLSQDRKPHFLLVSDSNNLVSVFKVSIPGPSSASTSAAGPASKGSGGGASPFLLLQLPKSSCTGDRAFPEACADSSSSGCSVYVTWVPRVLPEAGTAAARQASRVEGVAGPTLLGGGVFFVTVQSHQVVVWSLPVLRSYCVSQSITPEKQPLAVDDSVLSHCACVVPLREAWAAARALEKQKPEAAAGTPTTAAVSPAYGQSSSSSSSLPTFASSSSSHPALFSASAFLGVRGGPGFSLSHMRTALGGGRGSAGGDFTVQAVTFCPFSGCLIVGFGGNCVAAWRISSTQNLSPRCELLGAQLLPTAPVPPGMCELDPSVRSPSASPSASPGPREAPTFDDTIHTDHSGPLSNPFDQFFLKATTEAPEKTGSRGLERPASPSRGGKLQSPGGNVLHPATHDTNGMLTRQANSSASGMIAQSLTSISSLHVLRASRGSEEASEEDVMERDRGDAGTRGKQRVFLLVGSARNCCLRVFPLLLPTEPFGQAPTSFGRQPLVGPCVQTLLLDVGCAASGTRQRKFDRGVALPWAFVRVDPAQRMVMWSVSGCERTRVHRETCRLRKGDRGEEPCSVVPQRRRQASSGLQELGDGETGSGDSSSVLLMEVNQQLSANDIPGEGSAGTSELRSADAFSGPVRQAARLPLPSLLALPPKRAIRSVSSIFALYRPKKREVSEDYTVISSGDGKGPARVGGASDFEFETLEPGELAVYSFCVKKAADLALHELVQGESHKTLQDLYRQPNIQWVSRIESAGLPAPSGETEPPAQINGDTKGEARDASTGGKRKCTEDADELKTRDRSPDLEQRICENVSAPSERLKEEAPVCAAPPQSASPIPASQAIPCNDKTPRNILMMLLGRGRVGSAGSQTVSPTGDAPSETSTAPAEVPTRDPIVSSLSGQPPAQLKAHPGELCSERGRNQVVVSVDSSVSEGSGGVEVEESLIFNGDSCSGRRREERTEAGTGSVTTDGTATQAGSQRVAPPRNKILSSEGGQLAVPNVNAIDAEVQLAEAETLGARGAAGQTPRTKKGFDAALASALQVMGDSLSNKIQALAPGLATQISAALVACPELRGTTAASKHDHEMQKQALSAVLTPVVVAELTRQFSQHVVPGMREAVGAGLTDVRAVVAAEMAEFRRQAALESSAVDQSIQQLQSQLQQGLQRVQSQLPQQATSQRQNGVHSVDMLKQAVAGIDEAVKSQSELVVKVGLASAERSRSMHERPEKKLVPTETFSRSTAMQSLRFPYGFLLSCAQQLDLITKSLSAVQRQQAQQQQSLNQLLGQQSQQQQNYQKVSSTQTQQLQLLTSQSTQQQQTVQQVLSVYSQCGQDIQQIVKRQTKQEQSLQTHGQTLEQLVQLHKQLQADLQRVERTLASAQAAASHTRPQLPGQMPGAQGDNSPLSETEQLRRSLLEQLNQHKYEDAFSQAIAADIEQNTGGGWVLMLCNSLHPGKFFERDPLPLGQAALVGAVKILSEGLQEDLVQRRKPAVQQRVAWISEALFQIAGPLPQMCRSDFLDLVEEIRANLTWAHQQLQKPDLAEMFPRSVNDGVTLCIKQLKRWVSSLFPRERSAEYRFSPPA